LDSGILLSLPAEIATVFALSVQVVIKREQLWDLMNGIANNRLRDREDAGVLAFRA
jgi:hypothetical protein